LAVVLRITCLKHEPAGAFLKLFHRTVRRFVSATGPGASSVTGLGCVRPSCELPQLFSLRSSPWPSTYPASSHRIEPHNPVPPQPEPGLAFCLMHDDRDPTEKFRTPAREPKAAPSIDRGMA
jgi:hypothetical protein